jgi:hypothetical protein
MKMNMDYSNNGIAYQSNKLTEARFSLSPNEQKLIVMMVSMIFKDDKDFKDYEVRISDFSTLLNLKNKNIYAEIKDLLFRLSSRTVFIKEKNGYLILNKEY